MSRIANAQSPSMYFEDYLPYLNTGKIQDPSINVHFCYTTDLYYQYSSGYLATNRAKFTAESIKHKKECEKHISKPLNSPHGGRQLSIHYAKKLFNFYSWFDLYLSYAGDFIVELGKLKKIYYTDELFQTYLKEDCLFSNKEVSEEQILFFLEEHMMSYFIAKMQIHLRHAHNEPTDWVLIAYPWVPLKHHVYIMQQNFWDLPVSGNYYEDKRYDLTNKILRDLQKIDLATYAYVNV